ncbi:MAG: type II toxin-antitoxin system RelE/ParE family toxin [Acetobacteraceae bacterium]|nr:type II toxin-antitoxin system RelE/ParE family toxin [Acetobacteraceae bacterium]
MLLISRQAQRALRDLPRPDARRLLQRLQAVADAPTAAHPGVITMQGPPRGRFRLRQGDWRAVFRIDGRDKPLRR